ARHDLALARCRALLDPGLQQREAVDTARDLRAGDALAVAVYRRRSPRKPVAALRDHVETRERVDGFAPHRIEHGLVVVELLAGRGRRVVRAHDADELAAARLEGAQVGIGRIEPFGNLLAPRAQALDVEVERI